MKADAQVLFSATDSGFGALISFSGLQPGAGPPGALPGSSRDKSAVSSGQHLEVRPSGVFWLQRLPYYQLSASSL